MPELKGVKEEIERIEKILSEELPKIEAATDSHIVQVLLATLDKVEAQLARPGRYQHAADLEAVAVDALYRDAFLSYGQMLRRWLLRPEEERSKLRLQLDKLTSAASAGAARLPFWKKQSRPER